MRLLDIAIHIISEALLCAGIAGLLYLLMPLIGYNLDYKMLFMIIFVSSFTILFVRHVISHIYRGTNDTPRT